MQGGGEYDGSGGLLRRYIPGPGIDQPIAVVSAAGAKTYFHRDRSGSVVAMSDESGHISEGPYAYDGYGQCQSGGQECPQSPQAEPYRYTGRRFDAETGLYYYRARYYSAKTGRFLQTDPIGYAGGMNVYAYVGNDPMNNTDPSGMDGVQDVQMETVVVTGYRAPPTKVEPSRVESPGFSFAADIGALWGYSSQLGGQPTSAIKNFDKRKVSNNNSSSQQDGKAWKCAKKAMMAKGLNILLDIGGCAAAANPWTSLGASAASMLLSAAQGNYGTTARATAFYYGKAFAPTLAGMGYTALKRYLPGVGVATNAISGLRDIEAANQIFDDCMSEP